MITTIGAAIALLTEIITLGYKAWSLFSEAKRKGWINDGRTLSQTIEGAKTDEERSNLAKLLFEHRAGQ